MKDGWQAPLAALVVVILFAAFDAKPMQSAADIAAWVQGVGSLFAIIAAVWIYTKQYRDKKADDENETRAFVQAIRHEVETVWAEYCEAARPALHAIKTGQYYDSMVPIAAYDLVTYNNSSARVGKIDDEALRASIVTVYTRLRSHLNSIQLNNSLVETLEQVSLTYHLNDREQQMGRRFNSMNSYAEALKKSDATLGNNIDTFLVSIDVWLASHPAR
ncbi:hypothetical protein PQR34_43885 [Paraburkholderia sediminicola]|uniref:hypothetical protein n=1 Tax=Paraburkholderia sediminicola TaxID=458836 RepID=UPI0038BB9B69